MDTRTIKVLLFGPARDAVGGKAEISVKIDGDTTNIAGLRGIISQTFPEMRHILESSIFAVNNRMIPKPKETSECIVPGKAEIVLVPPVSGG